MCTVKTKVNLVVSNYSQNMELRINVHQKHCIVVFCEDDNA